MAKLKIGLITSVIDNRKGKGTALMAEKFLEHLDRFSDQYEFTLIHSTKTDNPLYKKYREIIIPQSPLPFGKQILSELFFYIKYWFTGERFDLIHYMHQRMWPTYLLAPARKIVITAFDAGGMLNSLYKP